MIRFALAAACMAGVALANLPDAAVSIHVQFGLFWVAVLVIPSSPRPPRGWYAVQKVPLPQGEGFRVRALWLLVLATLLGFGLRVVNLENSVHLFVDEMHFSNGTVHLRDNPTTPLLPPMNAIASFTWFYAYLQQIAVSIFGPSLTALRMVSVVFGTLTIPAVYLLARAVADRRTALLAAFVLATFPPHIHFSRLGLNNIADPLFGTLMLAFLLRRRFLLAGIMLGLTQYWYEGGKLIYSLVALLILPRYGRRQVVTFAGAALLVAMPLIVALVAWDSPYVSRFGSQRHNDDYWQAILLADDGLAQLGHYFTDQLGPALGHYVIQPDSSAFYYGGDTALILPFLLPFFVIGVVMMVRRCWQLVALLLLVALGNSLLGEPDWSARYVVTLPVLALLVAVGLRPLSQDPVRRIFAGRGMPRPYGVRMWYWVLVGAVLVAQAVYYFGPHLERYNEQIRPFRDHQDVGFRALDFAPGTHVLLFTDELVYLDHIRGMEAFWQIEIKEQFLHPLHLYNRGTRRLPTGDDLAIFVKPNDRDILAYLRRTFVLPEPQYSPYHVPVGRQYVLYYLEK